jgi:uncharacterized repeat protein (TIGR01451 family)
VRGNIIYVSNNIISSAGNFNEAPPGGSATDSGPGVNIDVDGTIFDWGSTWKYLDNDTRPANWQTSGFNDAAWASGPGQFGFGESDEATIVNYGPNVNSKYPSTYFRKSINIPNPALYSSFTFNVIYDDGFVLYLNGTEINRTNMPTGTITHTTWASSAKESVTSFSIPASSFLTGTNVLAIEMHQNVGTSSDLSFDMNLTGYDGVTFNSSSSNLNLPSCSQVLWAGLYWGAGQGTSGSNTSWIVNESTCKLQIPGASSYINVTSTQTDYHNNTLIPGFVHTGFKCFADITSLINTSNANGTYTLANVASPAGLNNAYGGWTIVIAYTNSSLQIRNLAVFDGNAAIKSGSVAVDIPISGFLTPPTGPVSCELGAVAYDGDRNSTDSFSFKQGGASSFYNLTPNATSDLNDMWNSTISYKGAVVTARNPAHQNTLGYDADIIDLPNTSNAQLGNNRTSATVRFASPNENYMVQVVSTSISQFNPSIKFVKSSTDLNGGSLVGNDVLHYRIDYKNVGADIGTNAVITDNIPGGSTYKPGTLKINGVAKTDAGGDDQSEYDITNNRIKFRVGTGANSTSGGSLTASNVATDSGYVEFDVYVTPSCALTGCSPAISNSARIDYVGNTSLSALSDSSGVISGGCFALGPLVNAVSGSCFTPKDTILMNTCPASSVTIPASAYYGYQLYSAQPFTTANVFNPSTAIGVTKTIYAFGVNGGCLDTVIIRVNINACPDIDKDNDGIPDYVESNLPAATGDHDSDGVPNYRDTNYPGFTDNNSDGIDDNFDPGADSDNDGIRNFLDANFSGFVDTDNDGVNDNFDTDKDGIPNFLDIDSDNDGIPDNIEAQATSSYVFASGSDSDGDGLDNTWDNFSGIGGNGVTPLDTDGDLVPDYLDTDSDGDGFIDLFEGNDLNMNHMIDDNVALTGLDSDGDGLDNFFDNNNSSNEGTSLYMGPGGSTSGDATPGSITTIQHTNGSACAFERDWRCTQYILECLNIALKGNITSNISNLEWFNTCNQEVHHFIVERSVNGINYAPVLNVSGKRDSAKNGKFMASDNIPAVHPNVIYYRLISYTTTGKSFYSPTIALKVPGDLTDNIRLLSNPVHNIIDLIILAPDDADTEVRLFTAEGSRVMTVKDKISKGEARLRYAFPAALRSGYYYLHVKVNNYLKVIKVNHQQ